MIDIHSHILPAVDDGSKKVSESLLMLKAAIGEGIHTIVATPHYNQKYALEKSHILAEVEKLKQIIKANQLKINVLPGQEIRLYDKLLEDYQAGKLLTIANQPSYMLIELPFRYVPPHTEKLLDEIGGYGIKPIIAHPERNLVFLEQPDKLAHLVKKGALAQLTTSSLTGYFGKPIQKFSKFLVENKLVHVVATDAHNTSDRSFKMNEAYEEITKISGVDGVSYFKENARFIIEGKQIDVDEPQLIDTKRFF